jgi:hypothetical protein
MHSSKPRIARSLDKKAKSSVSRRDVLVASARALAVIALPELLVRQAWGQTTTSFDYYISPTGSDSNPGTQSSPWAITSLQDTNSNNAKIAGKRVGLLSGTYQVAHMTSGSAATDYQRPVLHMPAGTAGNPTIVQSVTRGGAIFTFGGSTGVNAVFGQNPGGNGYCTLDGVVINGGGYNGSLVLFYGTSIPGVTVQNCEIYGITGTIFGDNYAGVFTQGTVGAVIQNNYFHDIQKPNQPDHAHAYEEYYCTSNQFLYNTIVNCITGVDAKNHDVGSTIAYNYFYNCPVAAIQGCDGAGGDSGPAYSIHHNIIDSCGYQRLCDINSSIQHAIIWYNNTCYDTRAGSFTTLDLRTGASNLVTCYNNINVATANSGGAYTGMIANSTNGWTTFDYNCYYFANYGSGWGLDGSTTYSSLAAWQAAKGADTHSIAINPQFTSKIVPGAGPGQFQLGSSSPAKGAGRTGGSSSGSACDMGAWGNGATRIGCNFLSSSASNSAVPDAPSLSVS